MKAKIFDNEYGKFYKIQVELEIPIDDDSLDLSVEGVIDLFDDIDSMEISDMVLENVHNAKVITE